MYVIPIIAVVLLLVIATAWSPIFAVIIAVPLFVLFLAYVGVSRRADQKARPASGAPASGEGAPPSPQGEDTGAWGERRS